MWGPAMALDLMSVASFIDTARTILLDRTPPYRYSDDQLLDALNVALLEGRRVRPDLFVYRHGGTVPSYQAVSGETVAIDPMYRLPFLYGMVGQAMLKDEEDVPVERANSFMSKFEAMLTGVSVPGASPTTQQRQQ